MSLEKIVEDIIKKVHEADAGDSQEQVNLRVYIFNQLYSLKGVKK